MPGPRFELFWIAFVWLALHVCARSSLGPQAARLQTSRVLLLRDFAGEPPAVPVKNTTKKLGHYDYASPLLFPDAHDTTWRFEYIPLPGILVTNSSLKCLLREVEDIRWRL